MIMNPKPQTCRLKIFFSKGILVRDSLEQVYKLFFKYEESYLDSRSFLFMLFKGVKFLVSSHDILAILFWVLLP